VFGFSRETLFPDLDGFARAHGVDAPLAEVSPFETSEEPDLEGDGIGLDELEAELDRDE
jgi:hypothetical protein